MAILKVIEVKESPVLLQQLFRKASSAMRPRLKMLLLISKGVLSTQELAAKTGVSIDSIGNYKNLYGAAGLQALLIERRGGHKQGAITKAIHAQLQERLSAPKSGFTSYQQALQWINATFGLSMK